MEKLEITSMSSRGQVVIPQEVREQLKLKEGEKFVVIWEDGTIILKKIEMPKLKSWEEVTKPFRKVAKERGITKKDIEEAIKRVRAKKG